MAEPKEIFPTGVTLRKFEDFPAARKEFFDGAKEEFKTAFPMSYGGMRVELDDDIDYEDPEIYSKEVQKKALLNDGFLGRRLRGTLVLRDETTGQEMERRRMTLMKVPYLTDERGTIIRNGNEYTVANQVRLLPGVYTRRQQNGEVETQFNVRPGTGTNFRVTLEPETSQYRMLIRGSNLHLYSLLKDLGISDEQLEKSWGKDVLDLNRNRYDARVLPKAYEKLVPKWTRPVDTIPDSGAKVAAILAALDNSQVHDRVARRHLPNLYDHTKAASWLEAWDGAEKIAAADVDVPAPPEFADFIKLAAFTEDEVRLLALYLNQETGAHIPTDAAAGRDIVEAAILAHVQETPGLSVDLLDAGVRGAREAAPLTPTTVPYLPTVEEIKSAVHKASGCLMVRLPIRTAASILDWTQKNIPEDALAEKGYEHELHVTVAFGFTGDVTAQEIEDALKEWGFKEIVFTLGKVGRFYRRNEFEVVRVEVESRDLREINTFLRDKFGERLETTFPTYKPHLTLAYVRPGNLKSLNSHAFFEGRVFRTKHLTYSTPGAAKKTLISLEN